jgi:nucleotidyltransferase/DNA polymerase involved in DNA repair
MNIDNIVNEQFRGKSFRELADAPLSALRGIGEQQANALADTLGVKTIGDLASRRSASLSRSRRWLAAKRSRAKSRPSRPCSMMRSK